MFATEETKTLKSGVVLPTPVVAASFATIIQILAENPLVLHRLQPYAHRCLRGNLPTYDYCYLWFLGVVEEDGCLKADFRDVFESAVSATADSLDIVDPIN